MSYCMLFLANEWTCRCGTHRCWLAHDTAAPIDARFDFLPSRSRSGRATRRCKFAIFLIFPDVLTCCSDVRPAVPITTHRTFSFATVAMRATMATASIHPLRASPNMTGIVHGASSVLANSGSKKGACTR
jgi:hypothetical protein